MSRHTLKRFAVLTTLAAVALVPLAGGNAQAKKHHKKRPCAARQSRTLAANQFARVYGKQSGDVVVCLKATRKRTPLTDATATGDTFALGGKWVAWSSGAAHSVVTAMHIPDGAIPNTFPFDTNDHVDKVVVKDDGATAWAASPSGDNTYVQGQDRSNHPPDLLSDDQKDVVGSSLKSGPGQAISWRYTDSSTDSATLF